MLPTAEAQLLLVVDQFEELFTQVDPDTASRFIDELVDLVTDAGSRAHVVITVRADFYDRPLRHRRLGELLRDGTEVITPLSVDELEAAITGPASTVGVTVDPLVVAEMVRETVDRPGALPLLQYTLTELFESHASRAITLAAYRAGGGVSRTLARRADSLARRSRRRGHGDRPPRPAAARQRRRRQRQDAAAGAWSPSSRSWTIPPTCGGSSTRSGATGC